MAAVEVDTRQAWSAPVLARVNVATGDGRIMREITWRELPLPLKWQKADQPGHDQSIIVGRIDVIEMSDETTVTARGVFDSSPDAQEAARLVREKMLRGVSVDGGAVEVQVTEGEDGVELLEFLSYEIAAATLVSVPAFPDAAIMLDLDGDGEPDEIEGEAPEAALQQPAPLPVLTAAAPGPDAPSPELFAKPGCTRREPLHIEQVGAHEYVWGHIAGFGECYRGTPAGVCLEPPRSRTGYAHFRIGSVLCSDGTLVATGPITLGGTHAPKRLGGRWVGPTEALRHYEDTTMAVADVACGEDEWGIWVAGIIRPGTTPETVHALRASAPSGDWREVGGNLELVAVHAVNMPGFPPPKDSAYVANGRVMALVASGAPPEAGGSCGCGTGAAHGDTALEALAERVDEIHRIVTAPIRAEKLAALDAEFGEATEERITALDAEMAR